jgi:hypothetical protein
MNTKKFLLLGGLVACAVGLAGFLFAPTAKADMWNKKTVVTINEPIIAGNMVLQPGTYVWKLMDSPSDRHIVQIFNQDESHIYETILAIPNYRLTPTDHSRFTFWETPDGVPKAVRAWFYPGDNFGQEFKYPKKLVAELASARPVPLPAEVQPAPEPAPAPAPEPAAQPEPAPAPQPEPEAAPAPGPAAPEAQAPEPAPAPEAPAALPKTASLFPLIGLLGLASLSISGLLSLAAKRS